MNAGDLSEVKAVVFDYGNTLIDARKIGELEAIHIQECLTKMLGSCDLEKLKGIRRRQIAQPIENGYVENDLHAIYSQVVRHLYDRTATGDLIAKLMKTQHDSLLSSVAIAPDVKAALERLSETYLLGLLSNYPAGETIRDSLKKIGIADLFTAVVVSGDVGYVKPHPKPFKGVLRDLQLRPAQCIYVGDDLVADIGGARDVGMWAVLTSQYRSGLEVGSVEEHIEPDGHIEHIRDLEALLARG